jgi:16S rRNA processing protein RimM
VDEPTIVVGVITKAHGLRGEVGVQVRSDNPDRFAPGAEMFLADGTSLTVDRAHRHGKGLLVAFAQVSDRSAAEALRGQELTIPESWLPSLPDGEYWPFQLEGCRVLTASGRVLGTLIEVIPNAANDLWVARDDDGNETLVPALRAVIVDVDLGTKRVLVDDVPGLTAPEEDDPAGT